MSSTSPEPPLAIDRERPLPATWALCLALLGTHAVTAVLYAERANTTVLQALVGTRDLRMRVTAGGQYAPLVDDGQGWRLVRSVFLHASGGHLVVNVVAVAVLGRLLEPWVGGTRLLCWFVLAGTGASIASHQAGLLQSDGASGGAFGLITAVVLLAWRARDRLDAHDRPLLLVFLPVLLLTNLLLSLHPAIDLIAHVAGMGVGALLVAITPAHAPSAGRQVLEGLVALGAIAIAIAG